jgi:hypothetical protein
MKPSQSTMIRLSFPGVPVAGPICCRGSERVDPYLKLSHGVNTLILRSFRHDCGPTSQTERNGLITCPPEDGNVSNFRNGVVVLCKEIKFKDDR